MTVDQFTVIVYKQQFIGVGTHISQSQFGRSHWVVCLYTLRVVEQWQTLDSVKNRCVSPLAAGPRSGPLVHSSKFKP